MLDSVRNCSAYNKYQNTGNYPSFKGGYTYQPIQTQTRKQGLSNGAKIAIGGAIITALSIGADFLFCKGKHVKNLLSKLKGDNAKPKGKPYVKPEVKVEIKPEIKPEGKPYVKPEVKTEVKPDAKPVKKQYEKPEVKTEVKPEAKPKIKPELNSVINDAKIKAEKDLEELSREIPNMSRLDLAKQRREVNRFGCELDRLEMKANEKGLTELENIRLGFLKQKRSLLEAREKQIAQSLEKYVPTVSDNSAVSMHHYINAENTSIREAISAKTKNPSELSEYQIWNIEHMEQRMAEIDKEFAQLPPLEKDCIVYRGRAEQSLTEKFNGDFKIIENAKVGDTVIPDTGYSYTAFKYDLANNWCLGARGTDMNNKPLRTIMYEIHLPKGAKVSRNLEHGGEVVMPRGAKYKVVDKKVATNGDMEVTLEYILPESKK